MQPLKIQAKCVLDAEGRLEQIKAAMARDLEEFGASKPHDQEVCVVGSGPSIKRQVSRIRKMKQKGAMILAIKGAHDFLISKGIIPHAAVAVDPLDHIWKCFQRKLPKGSVQRPVYLIASQCHPTTFDYLEDQRVILWHLLATSSHEFLKDHLQIGGGSTSGSRGIVLAYMMGFRKFHLFGFDSCLEPSNPKKVDINAANFTRKVDGGKGQPWGDKEGSHNNGKPEIVMELVVEGKTFYADPAMAAQANEIQQVFAMLEGAKIKAYGKGLIQEIIKSNASKGLEGYYAPSQQYGTHTIPPVREETRQFIERKLRAAREGIYRGQGWFPEDREETPAGLADSAGVVTFPTQHTAHQTG